MNYTNNNKKMGVKKVKNNTTKARRKKKKSKNIVLKILIIILIILLAGAGYLYYKTQKNGGGMQGLLTTVLGQEEIPLEEVEPINVLVLGTSQNMSDTIIVCQYNPQTQQGSMLSIPRDTYTGTNKANAHPYEKINSRYIASGVEGVKTQLKRILNIDLDYYVVVDTEALIKLVDEIGGVDFEVPIDMDYDDESQDLYIHLQAGYQHIDGQKAEQLLRFRHNNDGSSYPIEYGDQDYGRTRTQREFITATLKQTLKPANIFKLGKILEIVNTYVDTNIDIELAKRYIPYAVSFNTENVKSGLLPGKSELCNGVWIFLPDTYQVKQTVKEFFEIKQEEEPEIDETKKKNIKIEILNGSEEEAKLKEIKEKLIKEGYEITKTALTPKPETTTTIVTTKTQEDETTRDLKRILNETGTVSRGTIETADYKIIIGTDYEITKEEKTN